MHSKHHFFICWCMQAGTFNWTLNIMWTWIQICTHHRSYTYIWPDTKLFPSKHKGNCVDVILQTVVSVILIYLSLKCHIDHTVHQVVNQKFKAKFLYFTFDDILLLNFWYTSEEKCDDQSPVRCIYLINTVMLCIFNKISWLSSFNGLEG